MPIRDEGAGDGAHNMRRDAEMLQEAERGTSSVRVYRWNGLWVSLGRFQTADSALVNPSETAWVLRPTGGKAVLHGHDVTVSMASPLSELGIGESRATGLIYGCFVRPLVAALRECGLPAVIAGETRFGGSGARTADCFAFSSAYDVVHEETGLKVCGCALRITEAAALLQASIPCGPPLADPRSVILGASEAHGAAWDSSALAGALSKGSLVGHTQDR